MDAYNSPSTQPLYRGTQAVWYIVGFIEILLLFRFILKLLGANPVAGFTDLIYTLSYYFVAPFLNVFSKSYIEGSVFEWTTLLAMLVYYVSAWGIIKLFLMGRTVSTPEAAAKLSKQE